MYWFLVFVLQRFRESFQFTVRNVYHSTAEVLINISPPCKWPSEVGISLFLSLTHVILQLSPFLMCVCVSSFKGQDILIVHKQELCVEPCLYSVRAVLIKLICFCVDLLQGEAQKIERILQVRWRCRMKLCNEYMQVNGQACSVVVLAKHKHGWWWGCQP